MMPKMYPKIIRDIKSGLLPMTTLVLKDLAMETGQLTAKQSRKRTSQMLKLVIAILLFLEPTLTRIAPDFQRIPH